MSPNPNSQPLPDWVDATVADWIQTESKAMEDAWGPQTSRAAIAFVHIPPSVTHLFDTLSSLLSLMLPLFLQTCYSGASIRSKLHQESGIEWCVDVNSHCGQYSKEFFSDHALKFLKLIADVLGNGSVQDSASQGNDSPFWNSLNSNVKNLHAVISGHGAPLVSSSSTCILETRNYF